MQAVGLHRQGQALGLLQAPVEKRVGLIYKEGLAGGRRTARQVFQHVLTLAERLIMRSLPRLCILFGLGPGFVRLLGHASPACFVQSKKGCGPFKHYIAFRGKQKEIGGGFFYKLEKNMTPVH